MEQLPSSPPRNLNELRADLEPWQSSMVCGSAPVRIAIVAIGTDGSDYDVHQSHEAVLILDGSLTLEVNGRIWELNSGDFFRIEAGARHRVVSGRPGTLLTFETP